MGIKLASIFTDNMIIQRGMPVKVFGTSDTAGDLTVKIGSVTHSETIGAGVFCVTAPEITFTADALEMVVSFGSTDIRLTDILLGEVWFAGGQSNMEQPLFTAYNGFEDSEKFANPNIRLFTVPRRTFPGASIYGWHFEAQKSDDTPWQVCTADNGLRFSAAGFYFANKLYEKYQVPVGMINCNWGGTRIETWMDFLSVETSGEGADTSVVHYKKVMSEIDMGKYTDKYNQYQAEFGAALASSNAVEDAHVQGADEFARRGHYGEVKTYPDYGPRDPNRPACLYENMVKLVAPFAMRGVIWYQGESNAGYNESKYYSHLFGLMVSDWRKLWGIDLSFIAVELAPFFQAEWNNQDGEMWSYLREQQRIAADNVSNSALIQIADAGDRDNIHPCDKRTPGERLAVAAMNIAYGDEIEFSGPVFESARFADGGVYVKFTHSTGGLEIRGGKLTDIRISDSASEVAADAKIVTDDTIFVSNDNITNPSSVKYGFRNMHEINLYNKAGIPASPFRIQG